MKGCSHKVSEVHRHPDGWPFHQATIPQALCYGFLMGFFTDFLRDI